MAKETVNWDEKEFKTKHWIIIITVFTLISISPVIFLSLIQTGTL